MKDKIIIGLSGKARAGKDTTANIITSILACDFPSLKVETVSFAKKLKEIAKDVFSWDGDKNYYPLSKDKGRNLLINIGLKMREIRDTIWVDYVMKSISISDKQIFLITDVRFKNEAKIIKNAGGFIVRITRNSGQLNIADESENDLDDYKTFDAEISNDSDYAHLSEQVNKFVYKLLK